MLQLVIDSFVQILTPRFRGVLVKTILLTLGLLLVAGIGLESLLAHLATGYGGWIAAMALVLGGLTFVVAAAYLMAPISTLVAGFFLDDVAAMVEADDYAADPPGVAVPAGQALLLALRFSVLVALVNLLALLLLLVPGINLVAFFVANAYLLAREYFELAAARFHGIAGAREMRRRHMPLLFLYGLAIAAVLAVPVVNLVTPLFGTVLMVHVHKRLARRGPAA